jgi:hypothetical protein
MRLPLKLATAAAFTAILGITGCSAAPSMTDMATLPHAGETHHRTVNTDTLPYHHPPFVILTAYSLPHKYTMPRGGTLSSAAQALYGHSRYWGALYLRNKSEIGANPDNVKTGTVLRVPRRPWRWHYTPPKPAVVETGHASPPPASPPPAGSGFYSYAALESLWVSAGGPSSAESEAATVAECESGGNPNAYNASGASGLFQILGSVVPGNLFNPMVNTLNAVSKFKASGDTFAQWVCQP